MRKKNVVSVVLSIFFLLTGPGMAQNACAAIPAEEREALINFYNSTAGSDWNVKTGWLGNGGTECDWEGITCEGGDTVTAINLVFNNLVGNLPVSLLADLSNLQELNLFGNHLSGTIPPEIGNLSNLRELHLQNNSLSGAIPSNLGSLSILEKLSLQGNMLAGPLPRELTNLSTLTDNGSDFRNNALYTSDNDLRTFLNTKQADGDWESTQTVAPANLSIAETASDSVTISWDKITYSDDSGAYEIEYGTVSGGPYDSKETTADKNTESFTITGLDPETGYYFRVRTFSRDEDDRIYSDYTEEIFSATTEVTTTSTTTTSTTSTTTTSTTSTAASSTTTTTSVTTTVPTTTFATSTSSTIILPTTTFVTSTSSTIILPTTTFAASTSSTTILPTTTFAASTSSTTILPTNNIHFNKHRDYNHNHAPFPYSKHFR
ncbi:MAG: hypothetical protein B6245_20620 [Desulfobacteraceae bacterium 4572_88]|nr:MAG: hypothetical protein B6245_20620 [Desulfobacteraceae bacterium 4572_88]